VTLWLDDEADVTAIVFSIAQGAQQRRNLTRPLASP